LTVSRSGILCVNKPVGWTSFDVVRFSKGKWKIKQIGHTGTLDPMAEGVLVLCFGAATKLSGLFLKLSKNYIATIRFGITTDTDDITGNLIENSDVSNLSKSSIMDSTGRFKGKIMQSPPKFSAIKISGQPAYRKARQEKDFYLREREIVISDFLIHDIDLPDVTVEINCSSGTYIRSIARDWGKDLGVGGTLAGLKRTSVGHLTLKDCNTIEQLREYESPPFLDIDYAASFLPRLPVNDSQTVKILHGEKLDRSLIEKFAAFADGVNKILLVKRNRCPLALIEKTNSTQNGYRYLRLITEWK